MFPNARGASAKDGAYCCEDESENENEDQNENVTTETTLAQQKIERIVQMEILAQPYGQLEIKVANRLVVVALKYHLQTMTFSGQPCHFSRQPGELLLCIRYVSMAELYTC